MGGFECRDVFDGAICFQAVRLFTGADLRIYLHDQLLQIWPSMGNIILEKLYDVIFRQLCDFICFHLIPVEHVGALGYLCPQPGIGSGFRHCELAALLPPADCGDNGGK